MRPSGPNVGRGSCSRPDDDGTRATVTAFPPVDGNRTISYQLLAESGLPWNVTPEPRMATISFPLGLHDGWMYSPGSVVTRTGGPPATWTFQMCPGSTPSHDAKTSDEPSGDHAGAYSNGWNDVGVRRRGVPEGSSWT